MDNIVIGIVIALLVIFVIIKIVGYGIDGFIRLLLKSIIIPIKFMFKGFIYLCIKVKELISYLIKAGVPKIIDGLKYIFLKIIKIIYQGLYQIYKLLSYPFRKIKENIGNN